MMGTEGLSLGVDWADREVNELGEEWLGADIREKGSAKMSCEKRLMRPLKSPPRSSATPSCTTPMTTPCDTRSAAWRATMWATCHTRDVGEWAVSWLVQQYCIILPSHTPPR